MTDQPTPGPRRIEPTGNPRVDVLIDAMVCPTCRTIYNAAKAGCADPWHHDNRSPHAAGGVGPLPTAEIFDGTAWVPVPADQAEFERGVAEGLRRAIRPSARPDVVPIYEAVLGALAEEAERWTTVTPLRDTRAGVTMALARAVTLRLQQGSMLNFDRPWEADDRAEGPVPEGAALGVTDEQRNDLHKHLRDLRDLVYGPQAARGAEQANGGLGHCPKCGTTVTSVSRVPGQCTISPCGHILLDDERADGHRG